jgi:alkanesulfonate monooxygenase SsuD/methylene tetrahydromethanopterin reductase-like flavin-dependent oxidoreductase (luciferase family)
MMRSIEFGSTGFYPAFSGAERAKLSEEMGFDFQGFSENHAKAADCFGEMRDALRVTSRIKLACGPVNFVTRNPGVVAAGILPIQVLSGGRAICNIAVGDSAVAAAGLAPQRIADLERDIGYLRTYLEGGEIRFGERVSRLEWAAALTWDPIPIQMVCSGPRSIALAARLADRICLGVGCNRERVAWALSIIDEGLAASGRPRDSIRVGMFAPLAITEDRASGRAVIRTRVAAWAHMQSGKGVDLSQQPEILRKVTSVLRDSYDYRFHHPDAPPENPNSAVCDEDFGDWMGVGGPVSYVVDRMSELVDMGIDFFVTALPMPERVVFSEAVMAPVRALRV